MNDPGKDDLLGVFHDPQTALPLTMALRQLDIDRNTTLMHVCGTHEHALARAGIRSMLPRGLRLVAGPGCPVCVCPASDVSLAIEASRMDDVILTTFGDMFRVPSGDTSLEKMKAEGADIRVIYSPMDAVETARENPGRETVFMAVGFETTIAPIAAVLKSSLPSNFTIISSLRLVPPALRFLLDRAEGDLDGFILPGHVSTVLGRAGYSFLEEDYMIPAVIAGFEPVDILLGIIELAEMVREGPPYRVSNLYRRVVTEEGNLRATRLIYEIFEECDSSWRGIGVIPGSGLKLREGLSGLDAVSRLGLTADPEAEDVPPGCQCHRVILGEIEPEACPLFGEACTPRSPVGPCMVSSEGTCRARYIYRSR